jgi:hypothetical protein
VGREIEAPPGKVTLVAVDAEDFNICRKKDKKPAPEQKKIISL